MRSSDQADGSEAAFPGSACHPVRRRPGRRDGDRCHLRAAGAEERRPAGAGRSGQRQGHRDRLRDEPRGRSDRARHLQRHQGAGQARRRQAGLLRHRRRPRQGARLREDDEDAGRAGLPAVPARREGIACDLQGGPAGRAGDRDRHPPEALPDELHGRRQRVRRLRRRRDAPARRSRRTGTASTTRGSRSRSPRSAPPNEQRMGGYRKGFQSSAPARSRT